MATNPAPTPEQESFEAAIERLESIVEAMESDKMPLEELLVRYEEGIKLVKVCQEKIQSAEKRIELITRNAAGKAQLTGFEPAGEPPLKGGKPANFGPEDVRLF